MEQKTQNTKGKKTRRSFILTLAIIAIIGYFVISLVSLQFEIQDKTKQVAAAQATLSEDQEQNAELKELSADKNSNSYMERIARDVLGYVLPGESVYYDVSAGN